MKRKRVIQIGCTQKSYDKIQKYAERFETSMSNLCLHIVLKQINKTALQDGYSHKLDDIVKLMERNVKNQENFFKKAIDIKIAKNKE